MPPLKTYDLFICHAWMYGDDYYRLMDLLGNAANFRFRDYSVPQHDRLETKTAAGLRSALTRQIRPVNAVIVLSGMYAAHRTWMKREVASAASLGKPIVAVKPRGYQRMPLDLSQQADVVVNWNTASIVSAIRSYSI